MKTYVMLWLLAGSLSGYGRSLFPPSSAADTGTVVRPAGEWVLRGVVLDSVSRQPVPFATLRLVELRQARESRGTSANGQGQFTLNLATENAYRIEVSSVGYQSRSLPLLPDAGQPLLQIVLKAAPNTLKEVAVRASRPLVEEQLDRLVYHADRDQTAQGGLATDLMRKVPLVTVLPDGGLSVRGSTSVKLLVNGRSSVLSNNPAELLRQIPAESIKAIEVITTPSARYEAEGATLVNIVTKKNLAQGLNATLNGGIGSTGSNAASSLSANYKKLSLNAGLTGNWFYNPFAADADLYQIEAGERQKVLRQEASGTMGIQVVNANAGVEYRLTDKSRLLLGLNHRVRQVRTDREATFRSPLDDSPLPSGNYHSRMQAVTNDWSAEYSRTFGRAQQELVLSWTGGTTRNRTVSDPAPPGLSDTRALNREQVFQADYQYPLRRNWLVETGVRFTSRTISNSLADSLTDRRLSTLQYRQQIGAAYLSSQWDLKNRWSFRAGMRLEQTYNRIEQATGRQPQQYTNLFPNVLLQKKLKNARSLKLAYGLRIQRPPAQLLNPAVATVDPVSRFAGSPDLLPERMHTAEASFSTYVRSNSLIISAFSRRTEGAISPYNSLVGSTLVTRFVNLRSQHDLGLNLYGSVKVWKSWQTIATANVYYTRLQGSAAQANLTNGGINYALGTISTWEVTPNWAAQFYGGFNSSKVRLQGRDAAFSYYQMSVRRNLPKQKGSVALGIDNPFQRRMAWVSYNEAAGFAFRSTSYQYNRGVRLTMIYRIGKSGPKQESARSRERRQSDLKEDQ
ncbi:outer membrane beta-barrel protein [Tellurirhabdus rosea]|uniref:outer membrane beta-barrel protein n=1 Tax=Tellurirhabdus rosea TaxID=2674997 RepID=UPI002259DC7C|nr:outer membrane beta-barrel protein [Tellurirhabdus rosea]